MSRLPTALGFPSELHPVAPAQSKEETSPNPVLVGPVNGSYHRSMATIPLTDAKARLNELVGETSRTHERVTITRHGRPVVMLIAVEDLEAMEEALFWQAQPTVHEDIESGRAAAPAELHDEADVRRRYGVGSGR